MARAIDPLASLTVASGLVSDAYAGGLLLDGGGVEPLPGLPGDILLATDSPLIETVRARLIAGELHLTCLWPRSDGSATQDHVRVTYLAVPGAPLPGLRGVVLLSPGGVARGLTARELEVLGMMVEGCSNGQIAGRLMVTGRTVATHVEHILAKLASPTRTHAAVHAHREGLYVPAHGHPGRAPSVA